MAIWYMASGISTLLTLRLELLPAACCPLGELKSGARATNHHFALAACPVRPHSPIGQQPIMASGTVPPQRVALLALAVLSLSLSFPRLSLPVSSHPLARDAAAAAGGEASEPDDATALAPPLARRACTYTVQIKTSCSSPRSSADAVSLAFGDAYRNEVYAARLTPRYGFERCATDTFRVAGPCGYGVCYLYLRRSGRAGWTPEWVRVYEPTTSGTPSTFYYGDPLPDGVWYGFDRCVAAGAGAGASSEPGAAAQAL